ncbi:MAG: hypothetical protein FWC70_03500 [Defluviitaleaceae bacterium]|nr:hypothetical protein [Defluviitaleaceae bacterium]
MVKFWVHSSIASEWDLGERRAISEFIFYDSSDPSDNGTIASSAAFIKHLPGFQNGRGIALEDCHLIPLGFFDVKGQNFCLLSPILLVQDGLTEVILHCGSDNIPPKPDWLIAPSELHLPKLQIYCERDIASRNGWL